MENFYLGMMTDYLKSGARMACVWAVGAVHFFVHYLLNAGTVHLILK